MRKTVVALILILGLLFVVFWWKNEYAKAPAKEPNSPTSNTAQTNDFDKSAHSTTQADSLWVIVNKQHPVSPITYAPSDLRKPNVTLRVPGATEMKLRNDAATALEKMFAAAKAKGIDLQVSTAYRGYTYQKTLYDGYVASQGLEKADTVSARPGYSEHQTGWAVDIRSVPDTCGLETCFGDTPAGKWLAANAHTYGYLLRYPANKTEITGYSYEPWHFRYIGTELSAEMLKQQITTLEEYFGVSGGPNY